MTALERAAYQPIAELIPYLGYGEKDGNYDLRNMNTFGHKNYTFIAQYFDDLWNSGYKFYNTRKNGPSGEWCDMTVDFACCMAFGPENARKVLYQPMESAGAGCCFSADYYRANGAWLDRSGTPKTGDQIFFGPKGDETHTGLVEKVDSVYVYTIEGNTSDRLLRRSYARNNTRIAGYGRPNYKLVAYLFEDPKEEDMTREETKTLFNELIKPIYEKLDGIDAKTDKKINDALGPLIHDYTEIPWKSVRDEVEEMVRLGVIDGGTSAEVNPNDVNMRLQDLRVLTVAKRFTVKTIAERLKKLTQALFKKDVE
jgi:hypothetical protein